MGTSPYELGSEQFSRVPPHESQGRQVGGTLFGSERHRHGLVVLAYRLDRDRQPTGHLDAGEASGQQFDDGALPCCKAGFVSAFLNALAPHRSHRSAGGRLQFLFCNQGVGGGDQIKHRRPLKRALNARTGSGHSPRQREHREPKPLP